MWVGCAFLHVRPAFVGPLWLSAGVHEVLWALRTCRRRTPIGCMCPIAFFHFAAECCVQMHKVLWAFGGLRRHFGAQLPLSPGVVDSTKVCDLALRVALCWHLAGHAS